VIPLEGGGAVNSGKEMKKNKTLGLKIVSVILAVLLWFYVVNQGALNTASNSVKVNLDYRHLQAGLSINAPTTVNVKLWGVFQETNDLTASVDLAGLKEGSYELPVYVEPVKGAMFTSVQPDKVKVTLEKIKENSIPISFDIRQNPPAGYEMLDIKAVPEKCIIQGAEDDVKKVSSVVCPVDLENFKDFSSFSGKLLALDASGNPVSNGITMIPDTVTVYVVINEKMSSKKVSISPSVSGNLSEGYSMVQAVVYPNNITVIGSEAKIKDISELTTDEIDITGHRESFESEKQVIVPEGVHVYPSNVLIHVEISNPDND